MTQREVPRLQLSIGGGMLILTAVAGVLALGRYLKPGSGGMLVAVIAGALPFSWIIEFVFSRSRGVREPLPLRTALTRLGILLLCAVVATLIAYFGIWGIYWTNIQWLSPFPLLSFLLFTVAEFLAGCVRSFVPLFSLVDHLIARPRPGSDYLDYTCCYLVIATILVYLCWPIARYRDTSRLPLRSLTLLCIYTLTNVYWFVVFVPQAIGYHPTSHLVISITMNAVAALGLWGSWLWYRRRFNDRMVVLWYLAFVTWLLWFAHPWVAEFLR